MMTHDTLPMPNLFRACREVADASMAPMHYAELTRQAFLRLRIPTTSVNWKRQIEDVREKLLAAGRHGFGYIGTPHCLAYLKEWLPRATIINPSPPVRIAATLEASDRAIFEALMRKFKDKTQARPESIAKGRARGLLIEQHVTCWFRAKWPDIVLPPENEGKWEMPCDHDFKLRVKDPTLRVKDLTLRIDVAGPKANGTYGRPQGGGKKATDIHVIAAIEGNEVVINGFVWGNEYWDIFTAWDTHPIAHLIFWLNCKKLDIDYNLFKPLETPRLFPDKIYLINEGREIPPEATTTPLEAGSELERLRLNWKRIIDEAPENVRKTTAIAILRSADVKPVRIENNIVTLASKYGFYKNLIEKPENQKIATEIISSFLEHPCQVRCIHQPEDDHLLRAALKMGAQIIAVEGKESS